jgi:hypothetical protein
MNGIHRNGQRGSIGQQDANGFARFTSDTGAVFTVHNTEFLADSATPEQAKAARTRWASWPKGNVRIAVEKPEGRSSKTLIVQRLAA